MCGIVQYLWRFQNHPGMSRRKQANPAKIAEAELEQSGTSSACPESPKEPKIEENEEEDDLGIYESTSSTGGPSSPRSGTQTPLAGRSSSDAEGYPYQCSYCPLTFSRNTLLVEHEQTHSEHLQFTCSYCPRLFKHKRSRDRHTKLHTGDKKYKCQQCDSAFSRSDHLKIHMKTHDSRKPYKCGTCNRGYNTAAALSSHQQSHLKQESRSGSRTSGGSTPSPGLLNCTRCSDTFAKAELLQNHITLVHDNLESPSAQTSNNLLTEYKPQINELKIICMYCSKEFPTLDLMYQHVAIAHKDVQNGVALDVNKSSPPILQSPKQEIFQNGSPTYACDRCTMQFDSIHVYKEHYNNVHWRPILTATAMKDYSLGLMQNFSLEKSYSPFQTQPTDLSRKKKKEDTNNDKSLSKKKKSESNSKVSSPSTTSPYSNDKPCICSCCYAQLPNFKSFLHHMETHMVSTNNTLLGFCPVCGEAGRDPVSFTNHIFGHAIGQVPGRCCYTCKKTFERNEELQKHLSDVHILSVFKCSICNEIFDTKVSMQVHLTNKHSDECKHFKCYLCTNQVFHDRLSAELHISMKHYHQFAPNTTTNQSLLRTQYQVELDNRLRDYGIIFQCSFCQKTFKDQYSQYVHILKEHNEVREGEKYQADQSVNQRQNPSTSPSFIFNKSAASPEEKIETKISENFKCDICNRTDIISDADLIAHKKLHHCKSKISSVSLQCAYCNEYCKSRSDLENHMKNHQVNIGKGKHKCNICDEIYSSSLTLADHKLTHCKIVEGNNCVQCKSILGDEQSFYTHQLQHSNSNTKPNTQISLPANCIICCQTLQTDVEIKLHAKFHLKHLQKEFICGVCNKIFDSHTGSISINTAEKNPENLTVSLCKDCGVNNSNGTNFSMEDPIHLNNQVVQKQQFSCLACPQTFNSEADIQNHNAMHMISETKTLDCRLCKQVFSSPIKLQTHLIEHNFYGMNQYSCYVCSSVFTAASGLQNHIIGHGLDSRPYECSQCQMKFFFRTELDNHRFVHILSSPPAKSVTPTFTILNNSENGVFVDNNKSGSTQYKTCNYCSRSYLDNSFFIEHVARCPYRISPKKETIIDSDIPDNKVKEEIREISAERLGDDNFRKDEQ